MGVGFTANLSSFWHCRDLIELVPLFKNANEGFIKALVLVLRPQVALQGDFVVREGDAATSMYFGKQACSDHCVATPHLHLQLTHSHTHTRTMQCIMDEYSLSEQQTLMTSE